MRSTCLVLVLALSACATGSTSDPPQGPPAPAAPGPAPAAPPPQAAPPAAALEDSVEQDRLRYRREYYALGNQILAQSDPKAPIEAFLGPWEAWTAEAQRASAPAAQAQVQALSAALQRARASHATNPLAAMRALDVWKR